MSLLLLLASAGGPPPAIAIAAPVWSTDAASTGPTFTVSRTFTAGDRVSLLVACRDTTVPAPSVVFDAVDTFARIEDNPAGTNLSRAIVYEGLISAGGTGNVVVDFGTTLGGANVIIGTSIVTGTVSGAGWRDGPVEDGRTTSGTLTLTVPSETDDEALAWAVQRGTASSLVVDGSTTEVGTQTTTGSGGTHLVAALWRRDGAAPSVTVGGTWNASNGGVLVAHNLNLLGTTALTVDHGSRAVVEEEPVPAAVARARWAQDDEAPTFNPMPGGTAVGPLQPLVGAFTLTGQDTGLRVARKLVAEAGAFTLTGVSAGLQAGRKMVAAPATFTLTGVDAGLTYSGGGATHYTLTASPGAFTLTGVATGLRAGRQVAGGIGAFTLTGQSAGLGAGRKLTAAAGAFTLTGIDAALSYSGAGRRLVADAGTFTLTGIAAALQVARRLTASPGAFTLTGSDTGLQWSGALNNLGEYRILLSAESRYAITERSGERYHLTDTSTTRYTIEE